MSYTDFENVESGEAPGTIKGLLPVEDLWEALAYRKEITVQVFLDTDIGGIGVEIHDLTGRWQVRVRTNDSRAGDGSYSAPILFEHTLEWTARVISLALGGGLTLVTWQPLGDAGAGKQQTTIVGGVQCAVVDDVNDEAQMAAYGQTGAWRFVDDANISPTATPRQKYDAEKGFSLFTSEGAATIGGYNFFASWESRYYKFDIPQGAILETVFDTWQSGILTEAQYSVSGTEGASGEAALFDERTGSQWRLYVARGIGESRVQVVRSRHLRSVLGSTEVEYGQGVSVGETDNGVVEENSRLRGLQLNRLSGGALVALGATGGTVSMLRVFVSTDQGENWDRVMNEHLKIQPLAFCPRLDSSQIVIYGINETNQPAYSLLAFGEVTGEDGIKSNGWRAIESGPVAAPPSVVLPTSGAVSLELAVGGAIRMMWRDRTAGTLYSLVSSDNGKTYVQENVT